MWFRSTSFRVGIEAESAGDAWPDWPTAPWVSSIFGSSIGIRSPVEPQNGLRGDNECTLNHILQLPVVPRPGVIEKVLIHSTDTPSTLFPNRLDKRGEVKRHQPG